MAIVLIQQDRNVIPRWRDFASTAALGELGSVGAAESPSRQASDLSVLRLAFEQNRTPAFAADLISAALVSSQQEVAREAAEFIVSGVEPSASNRPLLAMARSILGHAEPVLEENPQNTIGEGDTIRPRIAAIRRHLKRFPEDAISWVDLSLLFARRGLSAKANRAMLAALGLEPANRFVLRSAARLFVHIGDFDRARDVLRRSPLVRFDPWITAAEIAVSLSAKRQPASVDFGVAALKRKNFSWHDATELAVALATLEWQAGNNRSARRLLGLGLNAPNENSLAQANHIAKDLRGSLIDTTVKRFSVERPFEVSCTQAYQRQDWTSAASSAINWLKDQPFSGRPAMMAGYIHSSILDDFTTAEWITKEGQIANPEDRLFNVQLAYIYASTNRTIEARRELARIKPSELKDGLVFLRANHGLIAYREGDVAKGRELYLDAVTMARETSNVRLEAQALLFWAREEIRAATRAEGTILEAGEEAVKHSDAPEAPFLLEKMKHLAASARNGPQSNSPLSVRFSTFK